MTDAPEQIATAFTVGPVLRGYIRGKLKTDPVFQEGLRSLVGCRGNLLDLGCGFGLFGLWLRVHGFNNSYSGFDLSEWKVVNGNKAAEKMGLQNYSLKVGNITDCDYGNAAFIAVFDVIHYLDTKQQVQLFDRLADAANSGATVLIRSGIRGCGWRSSVTIAHEWWTRISGWIRGGDLNFPTCESLLTAFRLRNCMIEPKPLWGSTPFSSHLFKIQRNDGVFSHLQN